MNQYFLEVSSKQKLKELRREGITGQAHHRLNPRARLALPSYPKLVALTVALLGVVAILTR
ncbi:MAG: hypothetical protein V1755_02090 [Chloroflexota bacterium]